MSYTFSSGSSQYLSGTLPTGLDINSRLLRSVAGLMPVRCLPEHANRWLNGMETTLVPIRRLE